MFTTFRRIEWVTNVGRAGRSTDAIAVGVRDWKCFFKSRPSFAFDSPFEKHLFQRLPSDRFGKVVILYKVLR